MVLNESVLPVDIDGVVDVRHISEDEVEVDIS